MELADRHGEALPDNDEVAAIVAEVRRGANGVEETT